MERANGLSGLREMFIPCLSSLESTREAGFSETVGLDIYQESGL